MAFKPTSPKQTEGVDAALRARKGRLIVVATDPEHQTVISLRIDPRVLAQTRFIACEDLGGGAVSGTWRAFSSTGNGLVIEAHPGMEFSIIVRPRAVDITGSMAGGPVRVSDVDYAVTTRALGFSYHTPNPFGGELSSHVRLTETEPGLFEGEEIGGWTGATARPFSLRWHHL